MFGHGLADLVSDKAKALIYRHLPQLSVLATIQPFPPHRSGEKTPPSLFEVNQSDLQLTI